MWNETCESASLLQILKRLASSDSSLFFENKLQEGNVWNKVSSDFLRHINKRPFENTLAHCFLSGWIIFFSPVLLQQNSVISSA